MTAGADPAGPAARFAAVARDLARRAPAVAVALAGFFEAVLALATAPPSSAPAKPGKPKPAKPAWPRGPAPAPIAPRALTAAQVLAAARAHGRLPLFWVTAAGGTRYFLSSIGLDLTDPAIRARLVELHRRGEIRLESIGELGPVPESPRGISELIEASAVSDGESTFHVIALP